MHVGEKGVERKSCEEKMRGKLTMIGNPSVINYLLCERGGQGLGYRVKPRLNDYNYIDGQHHV